MWDSSFKQNQLASPMLELLSLVSRILSVILPIHILKTEIPCD